MEAATSYSFSRADASPRQPEPSKGRAPAGPRCNVLNVGCNDAVQLLCEHGLRPALLNFAHGYNCGGGFEHAGGSQEEAIFRASSVFLSLWPHRRADDGPGVLKRGMWIGDYDSALPRKEPFYGHTECGGIYSPHVRLVRDCSQRDQPLFSAEEVESLPTFGVLTVAAQNVVFEGRFEEDLLYEKVRTILHMAAVNGHDTLVLGAFGCGYFRNPTHVVAEAFRQLLFGEFAAAFSRVIFAIPDRHGRNLSEFTSRFPLISVEEYEASLESN